MLDEIAERSLFCFIFAAKGSKLIKSFWYVFRALLDNCWIETLWKNKVKVRVVECFLSTDSGAFFSQHLLNKIFGWSADLVPIFTWHIVLTFLNSGSYVFSDRSVEGWLAAQKHIQENTNWPNITFLAIVSVNNFRSTEIGSSIYCMHVMVICNTAWCSKID